ncbi:MAG: GatB/YqeY domain-containing protein [Chlamydiae bacterium]|nr:GatB/YqeY domain-containing protein [Chlamydiota bacterium]MBI3265456.1 GatB/YqeY domain-containing protein [Chlamydiota bacterium]
MSEVQGLSEKLRQDLYAAMKVGDKRKVETLRMVISDIKKEEIDRKRPLKEDEILAWVRRGMKTRSESVSQFEKGGRTDLADKEKLEIEILKIYLPQPLTGEALKKAVEAVVLNLKVTSKKDMGLVMKTVMAQYGSQADGNEVKTLVGQILVE